MSGAMTPEGVVEMVTRPVVVRMLRWTEDNWKDLRSWCGTAYSETDQTNIAVIEATAWNVGSLVVAPGESNVGDPFRAKVFNHVSQFWFFVERGDWVAEGQQGEFYPVPDALVRDGIAYLPRAAMRMGSVGPVLEHERLPYLCPVGYAVTYDTHRERAQAAQTLLSDLDRSPSGRHRGDSEYQDPSGVSQGNPLLAPGTHIGYTMDGAHIVVPDRIEPRGPDLGDAKLWIQRP